MTRDTAPSACGLPVARANSTDDKPRALTVGERQSTFYRTRPSEAIGSPGASASLGNAAGGEEVRKGVALPCVSTSDKRAQRVSHDLSSPLENRTQLQILLDTLKSEGEEFARAAAAQRVALEAQRVAHALKMAHVTAQQEAAALVLALADAQWATNMQQCCIGYRLITPYSC